MVFAPWMPNWKQRRPGGGPARTRTEGRSLGPLVPAKGPRQHRSSRLILLLTDRQDQSRRISRDLGLVRPCRLVPLHAQGAEPTSAAVIVSDVALDRAVEVEMLRTAQAGYRKRPVPFLCLLRDDTYRTRMQALAIPATATLPADAPRATLVEIVLGLIDAKSGPNERTPRDAVQGCATQAGVALADMMDDAAAGKRISPQVLATGADRVLEAIQGDDIRTWLDVVWNYDDTTYQHCLLVTGLAAAFAVKLGFKLEDQRRLTRAALLHDIGKARIPLEILHKPGRFTPAELSVMRTHAALGQDILVRQGGFELEQLSVVRHHHEYLDGSGYPDSLSSHQIPDLVRLVTICDIYAALIEKRPYKAPMARDQAFSVLAQMGAKLDTDLLAAFRTVVAAPY